MVNYGSPLVLATYLHRIGRAGRFGIIKFRIAKIMLFAGNEYTKYVCASGTQGAAFTIISNDKELKLFSDFAVEGKLRTKLLRAEENLPSNLIYDDKFFSRSEEFRVSDSTT